MIVVDTSAWIDFFRGADPLASLVDGLLERDDVATCGPIRTELRRGIRSPRERARVLALLDGCADLSQPDDVWNDAGELGALVGKKGATVKTLDLLIAAWALAHDAAILTRDADFAAMRRAGVPLVLVSIR